MTESMTAPTTVRREPAEGREAEVLHEVVGNVQLVTLNRPKALNALNQAMIDELTKVLKSAATRDDVAMVLVRGAGERGLCAGGDVAALYRDALAGGSEGAHFWRTEYELNHLIATFPKPYVVFQTGIVLGGGIGISAHGSHRIVSDNSRLGMPEVGIGYSPDAGGSHLLSRAPDRLGYHLAYTAEHVGAAEAIDAGFADYYVPQARLVELEEALLAEGTPEGISNFTQELSPGFGENRAEMAHVYSLESAAEVLEELERMATAQGEEHWAAKAAQKMRRASPLGIAVTEESLRRNQAMELGETLTQEFWMSLNMQRHPEFVEGIRAQIVDKDRSPQWAYPSLADVPADVVSGMFDPIDGFNPPNV